MNAPALLSPSTLETGIALALVERHGALQNRMQAIIDEWKAVNNEQDRLRLLPPLRIDGAAMEAAQRCAARQAALMREELILRDEFSQWLRDYGEALEPLHKIAAERIESCRSDLEQKLLGLGFSPSHDHSHTITRHPGYLAASKHCQCIVKARDVFANPQQEGSFIKANKDRVAALETALRDLLTLAGGARPAIA